LNSRALEHVRMIVFVEILLLFLFLLLGMGANYQIKSDFGGLERFCALNKVTSVATEHGGYFPGKFSGA